jgi:dolichyl-phosphate beta-glucosyltransferase
MQSDNSPSKEEQPINSVTPAISVVIPAYNESLHLPVTLQAMEDYFTSRKLTREVLVIDDGSTDDTVSVAANLQHRITGLKVLSNGENRGKGFAVRRGMLETSGTLILISDADQSSPIDELDKLLPLLEEDKTDIAIGSRALKESRIDVHQPFYRERLGCFYNDLIQLLVLRGFKDTQCGFKLFRAEVAKDIFRRIRLDGFAFDVEALFVARKLGYRVTEVPIRWRNDPDTRVKLFRHGSRMVADLLRIRWNDCRGIYNSHSVS